MSITASPPEAIRALAANLISADHWADASFLRLPLIYPGGSCVTVKVAPLAGGRYHVSDGGFGFRVVEEIGAHRSFARTAAAIAEDASLGRGNRSFFTVVPEAQLERAISDVATASWQTVDRIYSNQKEDVEDDIVEHLMSRLEIIFGPGQVERETKLIGASTSSWEMTATVRHNQKVIAFQVVGVHANSIYRANAAFDDLASLENPPSLVAVVQSKMSFGPKLTLLARSARIIEEDQPDAVFLRAAA